jgi:hypothetical protein
VLAVQPYHVPLHGRLPPHDKLTVSNRVPLHAMYRFASCIITDITHHCKRTLGCCATHGHSQLH